MSTRRSLLFGGGAAIAFPSGLEAAIPPVLAALGGCATTSAARTTSFHDYPVAPVSFTDVALEDSFWRPRLDVQRRTLVPFALERTEPAVENLRRTAAFLRGQQGELPFPHRYITSDLYKVMEGASYLLAPNRDPALEAHLDAIIDIIADAQRDDGYMYEAHITGVSRFHDAWGGAGMGDRPYAWEVHSHETYNMGHMYEAAIAYYDATGKSKWRDVAEKNAQHINRVFFVGDPNYNGGRPVNQAPGHPELELALAKLYRSTGNRLYLEMAQRFLEIRGVTYVPDGQGVMAPTYAQQHAPLAQQTEAVGHAVRAAYLYSGMADADALTGSHEFDAALHNIWRSIVDTKMHITGGLGAVHGIEGFGQAYELPNKEAYNETCAVVANVFFNFRMFLMTKDAQYLDVAEVALFNNALAGVNLEGNRFFYVNPLESDGVTPFNAGDAGRAPWFETACCPSNLARLMPQISGMMYAHDESGLYVTLYAANSATIDVAGGPVQVRQETAYPFDGRVTLTLTPETARRFKLRLRAPTWARAAQFLPGALYSYIDGIPAAPVSIAINGQAHDARLEKGFWVIDRLWAPGDVLTLTLAMPVRFSRAREEVEADRGRVALTRGPLVYCAEAADNGGSVHDVYLPNVPALSSIGLGTISEGALAGVTCIDVPAMRKGRSERNVSGVRLVPYYSWNNRGDAPMLVWLPQSADLAA